MTGIVAPGLKPHGFVRLFGIQLRIWRSNRPVLIAAALTVLLGAGAAVVGTVTQSGDLDAETLVSEFGSAGSVFCYFWPVIGAVAGASAFTARWALIVVVLAPRRRRWLLATLTSFLLLPIAAGLAFAAAVGGTMAALGTGSGIAGAMVSEACPVVIVAVVNAAAGFLLGTALRSVPLAIVAMFLAPLLLPAIFPAHDVDSWLVLDTLAEAISSGSLGDRHGLPVVTSALLWLAAPAFVAGMRLRSSVE